jgi:aminocarboxymuconate-semialdehyde decarboxylase
LRGIEINGNVNGFELTDPLLGLDKVFAKAQELDVLIFMHPTGFTHGQRLLDHYFSNVIGNPLETYGRRKPPDLRRRDGAPSAAQDRAAARRRLPAHYWARMDHAWRARPDCRTVIKKKPSSYLEKFYFDTIVFDQGMLGHLVERFGAIMSCSGPITRMTWASRNPLNSSPEPRACRPPTRSGSWEETPPGC